MPVLLEPSIETSQINGLTRRKVITSAAGFVTVASLNGNRAAAQQASPTATGTRIVETIHGPVDVPVNPQRIVTLTYIASIAVAELGLMPVGVTRWVPDLPPGFPDLSTIAKIENEAYELDMEALVALQPDLIIGADALAPADRSVPYEQLSRIAPTALFEWGSGGSNWEVQALGCAETLGRTTEFTALRSAYDKRASGIKTTYAEVLSTLTVDFIDAGDPEWYLHGPASTHCKVAIDAGFKLGAGANQEETFTGFSFEQLNALVDTDALFIRGGEFPAIDTLSALPAFTGLPAVLAGHAFSSGYFYVASYAQCDASLIELETALKTLGE